MQMGRRFLTGGGCECAGSDGYGGDDKSGNEV